MQSPLAAGLAWLFMGAANSDGKLYDDEIQEVLAAHPEQFRVDYALSREGPKVTSLAYLSCAWVGVVLLCAPWLAVTAWSLPVVAHPRYHMCCTEGTHH